MAETVDDLLETLDGPVSEELHAREGARLKKHGSYKFKPLDVRQNDSTYVPHNRLDVSPTADQTAAEPGHEGTTSEGEKKSLHLDTSRPQKETPAQEVKDTPAHEAAESSLEEAAEHEEK